MASKRRQILERKKNSITSNIIPGNYILVLEDYDGVSGSDVYARGTSPTKKESSKIPIKISEDFLMSTGDIISKGTLSTYKGTISHYPEFGNDIAPKDYVDDWFRMDTGGVRAENNTITHLANTYYLKSTNDDYFVNINANAHAFILTESTSNTSIPLSGDPYDGTMFAVADMLGRAKVFIYDSDDASKKLTLYNYYGVSYFQSSGSLQFEAGGSGNYQFKTEDGADFILFYNNTANCFKATVEADGVTTLATSDGNTDPADHNANLTLDADGDITLDAATGNIYVKDDGGNYTPGSDYEIATKKYVDDNAGGGSTTLKHFLDWHYMGANLASTNTFYANSHIDDYGVSSTINTGITDYTDTAGTDYWRVFRYARRIPYSGTLTKVHTHVESTGASADSDIEIGLWQVTKPTLDTEHASTSNPVIDNLCKIDFDFSSASRLMFKESTSFEATSITEGNWLFVTMRRTSGTDGSSFNCHTTVLYDGS